MNLNFHENIPSDFNSHSRVWIYQSNRKFFLKEVLLLESLLKDFCDNWNSHGKPVYAFAHIFFDQFIMIMADDSRHQVGGCSTDSSIHFIKSIEKDLGVILLDRQMLAFIVKEKIQLVALEEVNEFLDKGLLSPDTLYFNNTILTKKEILKNWIIPIKDSWLAGRIPLCA